MTSHAHFAAKVCFACLILVTYCLTFSSPARGQNEARTLHRDYSLALSKASDLSCPESLSQGIIIQFQGTYSNTGEIPIDNVSFSVTVTPEISLSDFSTTQGTWTPGTQDATLAMGTVAPAVTVEFTFLMTTMQIGTATLTTQYSSESPESCNIEIVPPSGTVFAEKYNDLNSNGQLDEGEPLIEGWEFFLDENSNGELDDGERVASTDTAGLATFPFVPLGSYVLIEVARDGWIITEPAGFSGYSVDLAENGEALLGRFGNFRVPLQNPVAHIMDNALYWAVDRFGEMMPDGTFDFTVTDVKGQFDYTYLNVFIDLNRDGMISPYPVSKDSDQDEWVLRNIPLSGTGGLTSNPRMSAWFALPDLSLDLQLEYDYTAGITAGPVAVAEGTPVSHLSFDLGGQLQFGNFQWGSNDTGGQNVEDEPTPSPEPVAFPEITFVDFIPGPLEEDGMPDITQKTNECGPTSAANSLIWLARKHKFTDRLPQKDGEVDQDGLILGLMQAMAGNQDRPFGGLNGNQLFDGKKKYIMENNLPLVVEGGNTDDNAKGAKAFDFIRNEVAKGQDVELLVKWPGPGAHWVTISGYATSSEKKAVLFVHDPDDKKTAEVVWELEVDENDHITGKVKSPSESRLLWAVAESPVANIRTEPLETVPQGFELFENYPNPFEQTTTIRFGLPDYSHVVLQVLDMLGRQIETLADRDFTAGTHDIVFDASALSNGTYVCELQAGGVTQSQLMVVAK